VFYKSIVPKLSERKAGGFKENEVRRMKTIAIIDYDVGNLLSVSKALDFLGLPNEVTSDPGAIERADAVVLPGVGAFPDAADSLRSKGLFELLQAQAAKKPFLGICLGMQLLFETGLEVRRCAGLGLIGGTVERIGTPLKLPHIGWNSLRVTKPCALTAGLSGGEYVYFVHSFMGNAADPGDISAETDYGVPVTAMCARGYVFGCQFHPEKSGDVGLHILKNFGAML